MKETRVSIGMDRNKTRQERDGKIMFMVDEEEREEAENSVAKPPAQNNRGYSKGLMSITSSTRAPILLTEVTEKVRDKDIIP